MPYNGYQQRSLRGMSSPTGALLPSASLQQRDSIARTMMNVASPPPQAMPPGFMRAYSPLSGLMGGGDPSDFMGGQRQATDPVAAQAFGGGGAPAPAPVPSPNTQVMPTAPPPPAGPPQFAAPPTPGQPNPIFAKPPNFG